MPLVADAVLILACCFAARRIYVGQPIFGSMLRSAAGALLFAIIGWQAVNWLREPPLHPGWLQLAGTWAQLLAGFSMSALVAVDVWGRRAYGSRKPSV